MEELDRQKLLQLAESQLTQETPQESPLEKLRALVADEDSRNRIREMANIGSTIAEQMTGLSKGHRLGLDDTAKEALKAALKSLQTGALSAKDRLYGATNLAQSRSNRLGS